MSCLCSAIEGSLDKDIDIDMLAKLVKTHPTLLETAMAMQQSLINRTLGEAHWNDIASRRIAEYGHERYVSVGEALRRRGRRNSAQMPQHMARRFSQQAEDDEMPTSSASKIG